MYTSLSDMQMRYEDSDLIQLTDFEEPYQGIINEAVLNKAILDACAEIDLYLGSRYDLPLAQTPAALVQMASTITFYKLQRGRGSDSDRQDYEDVLKTLKAIASGAIRLDVGGEEPKSAAAIAKVSAPDRIFNRDSLKGF